MEFSVCPTKPRQGQRCIRLPPTTVLGQGWISCSNSQLKGQLIACHLLYPCPDRYEMINPMSSLGVDLRDWKVRVSCWARRQEGRVEDTVRTCRDHPRDTPTLPQRETDRELPMKACGSPCPVLGFHVISRLPTWYHHGLTLPGSPWVSFDILYPEDHELE